MHETDGRQRRAPQRSKTSQCCYNSRQEEISTNRTREIPQGDQAIRQNNREVII